MDMEGRVEPEVEEGVGRASFEINHLWDIIPIWDIQGKGVF